MRIFHWLTEKYRGVSYLTKLYLAFSLAILIPLVCYLTANSTHVQQLTLEQTLYSHERIFDQTVSSLSDRMRTIRSLINMLCADSSIQNWNESQRGNTAPRTIGNWFTTSSMPTQIVFNSYLDNYISRISLYMDSDRTSFRDSREYARFNETQKRSWDAWVDSPGFSWIWLSSRTQEKASEPEYLYYFWKIPDARRFDRTLGVIQADISLNTIQTVMRRGEVTPNSTLLLLDGQDEILVGGKIPDLKDQAFVGQVASLSQSERGAVPLVQTRYAGVDYIVGVKPIDHSDWRMMFVVPMSDITAIFSASRRQIFLNMALLILLATPLFYLVARSMTKRIRNLNSQISAAADGDYRIRLIPKGHDEIDQLTKNFNHMLDRTRALLDEQYSLGQALKQSEMHVLQEQINPHFLYNTLDLIHWMALRAGAEPIRHVVDNLSSFYQLSLGHGEDRVRVRDELRHVEAYVSIQNVRFNNRIDLCIDVPEEMLDDPILKLVFQPLVENAIQHGIREREDEQGRIDIKGFVQGDDLVFTIADDGVGMDDDLLFEINRSHRVKGGFGVGNVNDRLILYYGMRCALIYQSTPGVGTIVYMHIPRSAS